MNKYIDQAAVLGSGVIVGRFSVIEADVKVGNGVVVGDHVKICRGTVLSDGVRVGDGAVVGKKPAYAVTSTAKPQVLEPLVVGPDSIIGALAVVYAGSSMGAQCSLGDRAMLRENCRVGERSLIGAGVIVENDVVIGISCKIQSGAYITAGTVLDDHVFVAPLVITANDNFMGRTEQRHASKRGPVIGRGARLGAGATLLPGVVVAQESFIAAGSVVTKDTRAGRLYMGVPAREIRVVPAAEYLTREE